MPTPPTVATAPVQPPAPAPVAPPPPPPVPPVKPAVPGGGFDTSKLAAAAAALKANPNFKIADLAKAASPGAGPAAATGGPTSRDGMPMNQTHNDDPHFDESGLVNPNGKPHGMPTTTADILGSGMLTADQIKTAEIGNVQSMITCPDCSDVEKQAMAGYMQRMILDGYIRGVDIPAAIKKEPGGVLTVGWNTNGNEGLSTGSNINFEHPYWNSMDDGSQYDLFLHEASHELMGEGHRGNTIMDPHAPEDTVTGDNYDWYMGELFNPDGWKKTSLDPGGTGKATAPVNPPANPADATAANFPGLDPKVPLPPPPATPPSPQGPEGGGGGTGGGTGGTPDNSPGPSPQQSPVVNSPTYGGGGGQRDMNPDLPGVQTTIASQAPGSDPYAQMAPLSPGSDSTGSSDFQSSYAPTVSNQPQGDDNEFRQQLIQMSQSGVADLSQSGGYLARG